MILQLQPFHFCCIGDFCATSFNYFGDILRTTGTEFDGTSIEAFFSSENKENVCLLISRMFFPR